MTEQKRRRINEKRRQLYARKTNRINSTAVIQNGNEAVYKTSSAKSKAVARAMRVLPKNPDKFAEVMSTIVGKTTPKHKSALKEKCIISPKTKKRLLFYKKTSVKTVLHRIRKKRSTRFPEMRNLLHQVVVVKNRLKKKTAQKHLGLSWNFLSKSPRKWKDGRKRRKDALDEDTIKAVQKFFRRVDISRELPCRSTKLSSKRVMECSLKAAYKLFMQENPSLKMCFTTFYKLRPKDIRTMSTTQFMQCLCEYCVNVEFLLQSLSTSSLKTSLGSKYDVVAETLCTPSGSYPRKECIDRKCDKCGKHDHHAVHHFVSIANEHLKKSGVESDCQVHFSDGATAQYKCKVNFADMTCSKTEYGFPVQKNFFGSRHGKGPCDGEIGVVKRGALTAVRTRQAVIGNALDFYQEMKKRLTIDNQDIFRVQSQ